MANWINELPEEIDQVSDQLNINSIALNKNFISELENFKTNLIYKILVLSGPSGVGKSHIIGKCIAEDNPQFSIIPRVTTRTRRDFEMPQELKFASLSYFNSLNHDQKFLYTENNGLNKYGVLVDDALHHLRCCPMDCVLLLIGTITLSQLLPKTGYVYFLPADHAELINRLRKQNRYNPEKFKKSISEARLMWKKRTSLPALRLASFLINNKNNEISTINKLFNFAASGKPIIDDSVLYSSD